MVGKYLRFLIMGVIVATQFQAMNHAECQTGECYQLARQFFTAPSQGVFDLLKANNYMNFTNNAECFREANQSYDGSPGTIAQNAIDAVAPARTSLMNALESYSSSQQQGSNLSSSGSTNAVTKPSGPTALAEEFGGINATAGTSSTTFSFAPGTMLTDLALTGIKSLCAGPGSPHCISSKEIKGWTPFTFKVTANTSNGSQSLTGAAATSSTNTTQQVTISNPTTATFAFGGISVQYSILGSKSKTAAKPLTNRTPTGKDSNNVSYYLSEMKQANFTANEFEQCGKQVGWDGQVGWETNATADFPEWHAYDSSKPPTEEEIKTLQTTIETRYRSLLQNMIASTTCKSSIKAFGDLLTAILEAKTYEDFAAAQTSSKKPLLALEYDLNTPQNKPSYSTAKVAANWQFGRTTPAQPAQNQELTPAQTKVHNYADLQSAALTALTPKNPADPASKPGAKSKQLAANAKPLAKDAAQPWSITASGAADIYNSEPSSSIPSSSHLRDIQAGAEIAYLFAAPDKTNVLRKLIGDVTASAAYSYQDQTSPALLKGPALNDFTGLPTSTTTAYAQRGVIHLGQAKLGFGKGTKTNFPLAFTYSNRTELVVHPTWGVQFGVTYSLTSLFSGSQSTKSSP